MTRLLRRGLLPSERVERAQKEMDAAIEERERVVRWHNSSKENGSSDVAEAKKARDRVTVRIAAAKKSLESMKKNLVQDIPERITEMLNAVSQPEFSDCFNWDGNTNAGGYGFIYWRGKRHLAHRLAYAVASGIDPDSFSKLVVRHSCDNPLCINKNHLSIGTQADNVTDMMERGRDRLRGSKNSFSKLTESDVIEIRKRLIGGESCKSISVDYDITEERIRKIRVNESWKHVEQPEDSKEAWQRLLQNKGENK